MAMIETLENRQMLAVHISDITPDNRGEVVIELSGAVTGVQKSSVRMYTFGDDGVANTADDVRLNTVVKYDPDRQRIVTRVIGNLTANVGYRIRIQARDVRGASDGSMFDGEYHTDGSSGDGVGNGNYNARFRGYKSNEIPRARISTTAGLIDVILHKDVAPLNVANFLHYADTGRYDGIFVNRSVPGFIEQLGAAKVTGDGEDPTDLAEVEKFAPVTGEHTLNNTRGTLAFALSGSDANSGTTDFFLNLADNTNLDGGSSSTQPAFTVFATAANSASLGTFDTIAGKTVGAPRNEGTGTPAGQLQSATGLSHTSLGDVPINGTTGLTGSTGTVTNQDGVSTFLITAGFKPNRDLVVVRRVALLLKTASV